MVVSLLLACLVFVVFLLLYVSAGRALPLRPRSRILVVIAHPDDESMFFSPVLRSLSKCGHRIFVLCVSSGNFYGQGLIRKGELRGAAEVLGVNEGDVTVLDYSIFGDGAQWDKKPLSDVILRHVEVLGADCVISFDSYGVSGHDNHSSCFYAIQDAYTRGVVPEDVQIFVLDSVSLLRKYIAMFDMPFSLITSPFRYFASPRDVAACWRAMYQHRSQLLWFRVLFLIFSRYIYVNSLRRVAPVPLHPVAKKK